MPTENRSSNTEMVLVPRELTPEMRQAYEAHSLAPVGPISKTGYLAMLDAAPVQHQGEPVMRLECENLWGGDGEYAVDFVKPGWLQECREKGGTFLLYTHADPAEVERLLAERKRMDAALVACSNERDTLRAQLAEAHALLRHLYDHNELSMGDDQLILAYLSAIAEPKCGKCHGRGLLHIATVCGPAEKSCPECASAERNQCDGCQAGIPLFNGTHRMGKPGQYADTMSCQAGRYASAEPEPPQSEPEKPRRCASCDNCQGFNIGHDSSQQLPYSIRCENCHKEARAAEHASLARAWNALNQAASAEPSAPAHDPKLIGIVHTPLAEYDEP